MADAATPARPDRARAPASAPAAGGPVAIPVAAAAATALLLWSGTVVAIKYSIQDIDALTAGLLRSAIAALLALAVASLLRFPFPRRWPTRLLLFYAGVTSFAVWPAVLSLGVRYTSATHAALIMALLPVFTAFIAKAFDRQRIRPGWFAGAAIALAGTAWLILSRTGAEAEAAAGGPPASVLGDLIVLAGAIVCSSGYVAGARLAPALGIWGTNFWALALALLVQIPALAILAPYTDWSAVGAPAWGGIFYMAIGCSLIGYALWFWALGAGGIARIGTWQFIQPVLGVVAAALILFEPVTWPLAVAGLVIVAGTFLAQKFA